LIGKKQVSMFEMTKLVSGHVKIGAVRSGDCRAGQELTPEEFFSNDQAHK
jgi:hypothetical protein